MSPGFRPTVPGWPVRVRGVFEDGQSGRGQPDGVDIGHLPVQVDGQNHLRPLRHRGPHRHGVHVVGVRVHVNEDRYRAGIGDGERRCHVGVGDGDDLIPRTDAEGQQSEVKRRRAAEMPMQLRAPQKAAKSCSKPRRNGPIVNFGPARTSSKAARSSGAMACARAGRSRSG